MSYSDLRQWLNQVDAIGELKVIKDADWNLEIGAVTDLAVRNPRKSPAVLFDEIKGYPPGYRVLTGLMNSAQRLSLTLGMSSYAGDLEFITTWRKKLSSIKPIPPRMVERGPAMENIFENDKVNLWDFPVPRWNELDGGRYIGTACTTITRDPDTGRVNFGTYRVMVHDKNTVSFYISPGKHGRINRDKWFAQGKPCPVAVVVGCDPLIFMASVMPLVHSPEGFETELHWAGGVGGESIEVFPGKYTGLPLPAHAEIIIEGEAVPGKMKEEGPFLEWTGYYASSKRPEPIMDVKAVYHRNDPILTGVM
jgi:UbiD family decarboxylase